MRNDIPKGITPSIAIINPKYERNVASIIRAASCFDVKQLWITGKRLLFDHENQRERLPREMRLSDYNDVEIIFYDRFIDRMPENAVPVAIEILPGSESLLHFEHPENAVYLFGPEDGSVTKPYRHLCHHFVHVPVKHCMNLASTVHIVLWDRFLKKNLGIR